MSFFNKLGETLTNTSKDLAQKAKVMSEVSSLNGQIQVKEEEIQSLFIQIGKEYYENNKSSNDSEYIDEIQKIQACLDKISQLRKDILEIKGAVNCQSCGGQIPEDATFCTECGAKNEAVIVESENSNEKKCPDCDTLVKESAQFCMGCGKKMIDQEGTTSNES